MTVNADFKKRLVARDQLAGTFVKTPHPIVAEVVGGAGFDYMILDAEHAPFDRSGIDTAIIAARSVNCPALVRVPNADVSWTLNVLDAGAAGVLVPHVKTEEQARAIVKSIRYGRDGRGFAGTTRAAAYGARSLLEHKRETGGEVSLICQIEDPEGVDNFEAIAAVDGVDALFVGRADLAVAYGFDDFFAPETGEMSRRVLGAGGAATGLYCAPGEDVSPWAEAGASMFTIGSEHSLIRQGAAAILKNLKK